MCDGVFMRHHPGIAERTPNESIDMVHIELHENTPCQAATSPVWTTRNLYVADLQGGKMQIKSNATEHRNSNWIKDCFLGLSKTQRTSHQPLVELTDAEIMHILKEKPICQ